jgi:hypothetical protein
MGDELMAAGEARRRFAENGRPAIIVSGRDGRARWSDLWQGLPYILKRPNGRPFNRIVSGGGVRPYIAAKAADRWTWKPYVPHPAEIVFTEAERQFAKPYRGMVMIEPNVKDVGHTNKAWTWRNWQHLVVDVPVHEAKWVQAVASRKTPHLAGAFPVDTPTFRHALAVLSVCRAFVGTEGGMMHGAAAVGTPAVILWSEFISPEITGYAMHRNIRHAGKPCGMRTNCPGCRQSMDAITVEEVVKNLKEVLDERAREV